MNTHGPRMMGSSARSATIPPSTRGAVLRWWLALVVLTVAAAPSLRALEAEAELFGRTCLVVQEVSPPGSEACLTEL